MAKCITRESLATRLQCCERTISRAMQDGDLLPCSTDPVIFEEADVVSFLNEHRLGMARKLSELPEDFFTTLHVAETLEINPNVVRRWIRLHVENDMPHFRLSKTWVLFRMEDVNNWIRQQTAKIAKAHEKRSNRVRRAKDYYRRLRELKKAKKQGSAV
jgi:AraC-like DNA-binding protein